MALMHHVQPGVGTEHITIGMSRADVRATFGDFRTFRRGESSLETDQFVSHGVMATYDQGLVTEIEITPPASVLLGQSQLLGLELHDAVQALRHEGLEPSTDGEEFVEVLRAGVSLFCVDRLVDGVWIGPAEADEGRPWSS